ncbi:endonuclease/exonuclease/phosphatase family protein [Streptomyces sp. Ru87]|uniref:endonuclease/exonuclease/phosphatase family protein n=1 Tax=Streptomyces sp. Ru87 TaxID=2044307 RepID=UPI000BF55CF7|nr:endonuclease/exonuclease/phosphatase family protein [Streptomyces sp. Ru87]PGH46935.1 endonuclease/exonuclease/phosphatase [Streptomyces sp. Ru87]
MSDDDFRVVSWNVEHNGRDGRSDERWHRATGVLTGLRPHIVLRQELTGAQEYGRRALWAEAAALGGPGRPPFIAHLAPATRESPNPTGVYTDPALCETAEYHEHVTGMWHPICNPVVRLRGAVSKLSLASVHLCSWDPAQREKEAKRLTILGKPGMATILGGDFNSYPHRIGDEKTLLPDWSQVKDRSHFEQRTVPRASRRVSDYRPDAILASAHEGQPPVFTELGHYAATVLGQTAALEPTASLGRTDQGPRQRIDRIYVTPQLAPALTGLEVIATDDVRAASDHAAVMATFSLSTLRRVLGATETA